MLFPQQLHQLQANFAPHHGSGLLQRAQRYGIVLRIEEPVEGRAAGVHPAGHLGFGEAFFLHGGFHLSGDDTLDRICAGRLIDAFFAKPAIEGRSFVFLLYTFVPFIRFKARSSSLAGVCRVFMVNP